MVVAMQFFIGIQVAVMVVSQNSIAGQSWKKLQSASVAPWNERVAVMPVRIRGVAMAHIRKNQ